MKHISKHLYIILAVIFFAVAFIGERNRVYLQNSSINVSAFQKTLSQKEAQLNLYIEEIAQKISKNENFFEWEKYKKLLHKRGMALLIYEEGELKYWSDNSIPVNTKYSAKEFEEEVIFQQNSWLKVLKKEEGNKTIVGLILIKREYSYENDFLKNNFHPDFKLDSKIAVSTVPVSDGYPILDKDEKYLFSLVPEQNIITNSTIKYSILYAYILCILFLLLYYQKLLKWIYRLHNTNWWLLGLALDLILIRFLMIKFQFPEILNSFELFNPQYYASSYLSPSLGDLLITSSFILFFAYNFFKRFSLKENSLATKARTYIISFVSLSVLILFFILIHNLFTGLIFNSNVILEVYRFFDLTAYSFIGFTIIAFLFASFILLADRVISQFIERLNFGRLALIFFVSLLLVIGLFYFFDDNLIDIHSIAFVSIITLLIGFIRLRKRPFSYSWIVLILFIASLYTDAFIVKSTTQKEKEVRKVLAVNLATERDPVAELLLEELDQTIQTDQVIKQLILDPYTNDENILKRLQKKYFTGYLGKYDFQYTICNPWDSVLIDPDNKIYHCYDFFKDKVINQKIDAVPNSNFYFIDNFTGRISYLGAIEYFFQEDSTEISLFLELNSKLTVEELGYPELLLENNLKQTSLLSNYSYAKYHKGQLITQSGNFPYNLSPDDYVKTSDEYSFLSFDGYHHLSYTIDKDNLIIISKPELRNIDILIAFSYIFVFFFILLTITLSIRAFPRFKEFHLDFKNKIQLSMVLILLLSLILIGGGTVYYNLKQFENKQHEQISEKIQSVLIEVEHKIGTEKELKQELFDYISYYLMKFSNVFYSDINLYDLEGNLFASSRPEIFDKGLIGRKMNSEAFEQLIINKKAKLIHKEKIGSLSYFSAYVPFKNHNNEIIAYLNLPYFTKQAVFSKEITGLIVAIINIYVLLTLIAIAFAVFISNRLTQPLRLIQSKFSEIELGKKGEPIEYKGNDEIGSLVKEYNRMMEELAHSADMLAKSERESAWREMAKQIAHEIKNPLTPMKLNVQLLQRSWADKDPKFDKRLEKVSKTLIEQINTLSSIASEFSSFATMPKQTNQKVNIIDSITNAVNLFEDTENVHMNVNLHSHAEANVYADKEQMLQVFNNLIKNAIQAIPEEQEGEVTVDLSIHNDRVTIKVADNGKGISDELKEKLFQPSFTTKTSGMGLGLSIVKNIIESSNGTIWFETQEDKGTAFFVELPLCG